ncbi:MAG: hypothetical protein KDB23_28700, partial [Planctomycetales bacterium]|nr:hypothetical protein [Planctomycetales bacterium]
EDNPIAYYRFEEAAGAATLADSSANGVGGSDIIDVDFGAPGIVGSAGEFLGSSSILVDLDFDPAEGDFTIETWVYPTGVEEIDDPDNPGELIEVIADQQVFIAQQDGGGLGRSDMLISANRQFGSFIGGNTTDAVDPLENDFVEPEQWYHFVMTYDADNEELYFYLDGLPSDMNPQFPGANGVEAAFGNWIIGSHKNRAGQFYTGLLDEIAFYNTRLSDERILAHYDAATVDVGVAGDFDGDGLLTADDMDRLSQAVADGLTDTEFDLDNDGEVAQGDRDHWVKTLKKTWYGDANLDGEFNSSDLVTVFSAGQYEDATDKNSSWATGDWNGDGDFNSSDLVTAFQDGGYEAGLRPAVAAVPEPTTGLLAVSGGLMLLLRRQSR